MTFVDDYAHLPGEVAAAIATAREACWRPGHRGVPTAPLLRARRRLWPTSPTRSTGADAVVITDVYAAGEAPIAGVTGRLVAARGRRRGIPSSPSRTSPARRDLADLPAASRAPGDVVLTLGAGDLTTMPDVWLGGSDEGVDA